MALISYPGRLTDNAVAQPERPAITCGGRSLTRAELEAQGNRLAHHLRELGVTEGDMVTIAVPNSIEWFVCAVACWKIGAIPQPVSSRLPLRELTAIVELANPPVIFGTGAAVVDGPIHIDPAEWLTKNGPSPLDTEPLPDIVSPSWKAPTSGGSTGRPKLIVSGDPAVIDENLPVPLLIQRDGCMVMPGPMYHNGPLVWGCQALLAGNHVVLLPRFDAAGTLDAIERYRGDIVYLVPTMMKRIWRLPTEERERYDLSSLRIAWHLAEPCPTWLKEAWIEWLGPERIIELYGGTEGQVATTISGVEWLKHHGSVGRPLIGEISICDEHGKELPVGEKGEVWLRRGRERPTYRYIGAEPRGREGGWESLGDNGWLDEDGYLYLGDRVSDMILSGGANIYPAEVEAALQEHPLVESCAVIGLPDEDLGNTIHAIVQADPATLDVAELLSFLGERLVRYKIPRSVEIVDEPLRDEAGKVRRTDLRAARIAAH